LNCFGHSSAWRTPTVIRLGAGNETASHLRFGATDGLSIPFGDRPRRRAACAAYGAAYCATYRNRELRPNGDTNTMTKILAYAIAYGLIVVIMLAGIGVYYLIWPPVANAAPSEPGACTHVATTGAIVVYFCQPDTGPDFLVNNIGFMQVVE